MPALAHRARGRFLHEHVRLHLADLLAERHRDRFGEDEAMCDLEIRSHLRRVGLQAFDDDERVRQRAAGERADFRQRVPFGVPAAQAPLVLLDHRGEHRRHQRRHARGCSQDDRRADGIALVRHRRRAAAAGRRGLERFGDFRLHEQRYIARELSQRADEKTERGRDLRDAIALRVPGEVGQG